MKIVKRKEAFERKFDDFFCIVVILLYFGYNFFYGKLYGPFRHLLGIDL